MTITDIARQMIEHRNTSNMFLEMGLELAAQASYDEYEMAYCDVRAALAALVSA